MEKPTSAYQSVSILYLPAMEMAATVVPTASLAM